MKTKPPQTAVRTLNRAGVFADIIIARSPIGVDQKRKQKIATFCNVDAADVISAPDVDSIYDIPLNYEADNLSSRVCSLLDLCCKPKADIAAWRNFVRRSKNGKDEVKIAVVGKYFNSGDFVLSDVYLSVLEALKYSTYKLQLTPQIDYLSAQEFERRSQLKRLDDYDGILIPGGFGQTGVPGMLNVIKYAREQRIPYFGICYGMQLAVLEFAKNVLKLRGANTAELDPNARHKVVDVMPDQKEKIATKKMGGTMRLGEYQAHIQKGTIAREAYRQDSISERQR